MIVIVLAIRYVVSPGRGAFGGLSESGNLLNISALL